LRDLGAKADVEVGLSDLANLRATATIAQNKIVWRSADPGAQCPIISRSAAEGLQLAQRLPNGDAKQDLQR
jgi:hypothetical protein